MAFNQSVFDDICERLAEGQTLREICRRPGMPSHPTVLRWVTDNHEGCAQQYARARDLGYEIMADEILEIADDGTNDWMERQQRNGSIETVTNKDHLERSRQRIDARRWLLSKALPKKYGDKQTIDGKFSVDWAVVAQEAAEKYKKKHNPPEDT
jgi:hypothetical protein